MGIIGTKEAAEILGVKPVRVRQLIEDGRLPVEKEIGRIKLLDRAAVVKFSRKPRRPGRPPAKASQR